MYHNLYYGMHSQACNITYIPQSDTLISTTGVVYKYVIVIPWLRVYIYVSKIPSSHGTSAIYHLGRTHLIGERTNENSFHLFYTVASEDQSCF